MLATKRRRGHGHHGGGGGGGEEPPPGHANGLLAFGYGKNSKVGGGWNDSHGFSYPQGVVQMTKVVQVASGSSVVLALTDNAEIDVVGNGEEGAGGIGKPNQELFPDGTKVNTNRDDWVLLAGGGRLYEREFLYGAEKPLPEGWWQRDGPIGPTLPTKADVEEGRATWTIKALASGGAHCAALTTDGRVLGWGVSKNGQSGNGWPFTDFSIRDESDATDPTAPEGRYPGYAPWWVQTALPAMSETGFHPGGMIKTSGTVGTSGATYAYDKEADASWGNGTRSNIMSGVKLIGCAPKITVMVKTNNEVWYSGSPAGAGSFASNFAIKDTVWNPANPAHLPVGVDVIGLVVAHSAYVLLLSNGEVRFVGNNAEYMAGNGKAESATKGTREVIVPQTSAGVPAKDVVAVAIGEFSMKLLKSPSRKPETDGTVHTSGSNIERQQSIAGQSRLAPVQWVTKMEDQRNAAGELESLYAGGRHVIAISGAGEPTHFDPTSVRRGEGANGGDSFLYLMDDHSVRVTSLNWDYNVGAPDRMEIYGTLGNGRSENSDCPVQPLGEPKDIRGICAGTIIMYLIQEPGGPATPTITATALGAGAVRFDWKVGFVATGVYPIWREPETFAPILKGMEPPVKGLTYRPKPDLLNRDPVTGKTIRTYTFTGVTPGRYEAIVADTSEQQQYDPVAEEWVLVPGPASRLLAASGHHLLGEVLASAGIVTVPWLAPPKSEPALLIEYRLAQTRPKKGAKAFTLSADLTNGATITSLSVAATPESLTDGTPITITQSGHEQTFIVRTSKSLAKGVTTIPVDEITVNFAYTKAGASLISSEYEKWHRATPEADPAAESATFTPEEPFGTGYTQTPTSRYQYRIVGAYQPQEGAYGRRAREVVVT